MSRSTLRNKVFLPLLKRKGTGQRNSRQRSELPVARIPAAAVQTKEIIRESSI